MKRQDQIKAAKAQFQQWRERRINRQQAASDDLTRAKGRGACIHVSQLTGEVQ